MTSRVPVRVVLIGFMGAGKSEVGRALAGRLGWSFLDFDAVIEQRAGRTVAEIFESEGEAAFRRMEADVADQLLTEEQVVLASGGGWAADPERVVRLGEDTVSVWLRVSAGEALRRSRAAPGSRPLLEGSAAESRASELLQTREPFYAAADVGVDTDGSTVEDVTARILEILATFGIETNAE